MDVGQSSNTILEVRFGNIIATIRVAGMRDYSLPSLAIWRTESHFDPSLRLSELGKHANPRNKLTNCSVLMQPFDRLDDHSSTNLIAGTVNRNKGKTQLLCGVRDLIVILGMMLDVEDSILVLHSLLSYF